MPPALSKAHCVAYLLHGLHLNRAVMWPLAHRLRRAGYQAVTVAHPTLRGRLDDNAALVAAAIGRHPDRPAVLIGHSLGGLTAARAVQLFPDLPVTDLILLGSPFQGSATGEGLGRFAALRPLLGHALGEWHGLADRRMPAHVRVRTVAGTRSAGMGRLFSRFDSANDGTVSVTETRVPGTVDASVMHVSHTGMLFSGQVAAQVVAWLDESARPTG